MQRSALRLAPLKEFAQTATAIGRQPQLIRPGGKGFHLAESPQVTIDTGHGGGVGEGVIAGIIFLQLLQQVFLPAQIVFLVVIFSTIK